MKSKLASFLITALLCLLLGGCETVSGPSSQPPVDGGGFANPDPIRFAVLDRSSQIAIQCTRLQERRLPDGRLEVAANLQNHAAETIKFKIGCLFADEQGLVINDPAVFEPVTIAAGAIETVRFAAPNPVAVRYQVQVKQAR